MSAPDRPTTGERDIVAFDMHSADGHNYRVRAKVGEWVAMMSGAMKQSEAEDLLARLRRTQTEGEPGDVGLATLDAALNGVSGHPTIRALVKYLNQQFRTPGLMSDTNALREIRTILGQQEGESIEQAIDAFQAEWERDSFTFKEDWLACMKAMRKWALHPEKDNE